MGNNVSDAHSHAGGIVFANSTGRRIHAGEQRVHSFRVSCESDHYDPRKEYAGLVVWNVPEGTRWAGRNIKPGYFYIKESGTLPKSDQGVVHGSLVLSLTGKEPSQVSQDVVFAGFAVRYGEFKINSRTLNINKSSFNDGKFELASNEKSYIEQVVNMWKSEGTGFTVPVERLKTYSGDTSRFVGLGVAHESDDFLRMNVGKNQSQSFQNSVVSKVEHEYGGFVFKQRVYVTVKRECNLAIRDASGDVYSLTCLRTGRHYVDYNSSNPTIVQVSW